MKIKIRLLAVVIVSLLLGACAHTPMPGPTQIEWISMSEEARQAAAEEARHYKESFQSWWSDVGQPLYLAHQPVRVGAGENGYTMQWHQLPGEYDAVTFYPGHNPPGMHGNNSEGMYTILADKEGRPLYRKDGKTGAVAPNKLLANVSTSEDVNRMVVKGMFQVGSAAVNGSLAAVINKKMDCDDCDSGPSIINRVGAQALSESGSTATATGTGNASAGLGLGCPTGGCVELP